MNAVDAHQRTLAIGLTCSGFGFAVLEGTDCLIEWGTRGGRGAHKNAELVTKVGVLIGRYLPDLLVVEDVEAKGSRRGARIRHLVRDVHAAARRLGVETRKIPRGNVKRRFADVGPTTKAWIAGAIASEFKELSLHLPPERKPWMSEDARMGIFDAVALGLTCLGRQEGEA